MATILLVEDAPNLGLYEARLLEERGHTVLRCWGAPTPFSACPMLQVGSCPLADEADLIIFSCGMVSPIKHRTYRGVHLLREYRAHPRYARIPMIVVSYGIPDDLEGAGPLVRLDMFAGPEAVLAAVDRLLEPALPVGG